MDTGKQKPQRPAYLTPASVNSTSGKPTLAWDSVRCEFQKIWGYADFRYPQGEIVQSLLQQQDALIVMPTGGGKSICFQLPALLQTGLTLVISPLVALMENQVQELRDRNLPAAAFHSEIPRHQQKQTLEHLRQNRLRLLYLSPETLLNPNIWQILCQPQLKLNGLILDEAHCLVQWGDTFRPAYRRLGVARQALVQAKGSPIPVAAFTATAAPHAQTIIRQVLQLRSPQVFLQSPYRPNLTLKVQAVWTPRGRRQRLLQFIQAHSQQAGLVYVRTRRDSEGLSAWLQDNGHATAAYHAGLSPAERRAIESSWMTGGIQFVVCTCAFGMGVNKPDTRWVIHFQVPVLLSEYVQEVGRAGRDGQPAQALALISEPTGLLDPEDKQRSAFFQTQARSQESRARQLAKHLPKQGSIQSVTQQFKEGAIALSILHSAGQLEWVDPFHYRILAAPPTPAHRSTAQMTEYLNARGCRWQFLLHAFGFEREAKSMRCGHCDRCLDRRKS
jgi:ATP-dependent DNA helicase RecQ